MMDTTTMSPPVKAYFDAQCAKILLEMAAEEEQVEEPTAAPTTIARTAASASTTSEPTMVTATATTVDEGEVEVTSPSTMAPDTDVFA